MANIIRTAVAWSIECIKQDHGKDFLAAVPRYKGFCLVPNHEAYKWDIDNFYNRYYPFAHEPHPGYPKHILVFLNHIFGEQLDLGFAALSDTGTSYSLPRPVNTMAR